MVSEALSRSPTSVPVPPNLVSTVSCFSRSSCSQGECADEQDCHFSFRPSPPWKNPISTSRTSRSSSRSIA